MSTEHHETGQTGGQPPRHSDVAFEGTDVNTRTVLMYLFYLALTVMVTFIVTIFIFRFTTKMTARSDTPLLPVRQGVQPTMPPEPRLQGVPGHTNDPQEDLREKIKADEAANEKLGWIDKQAGIAKIPVEDAMKIVVAKGLATVPSPPFGKNR